MLLHRIAQSVGTANRNGKLYYGFRAVCSAPIVSLIPLSLGSQVAVGAEPHAQCAKCFREQHTEDESGEALLRDDPFAAPVYDEQGRPLALKDDRGIGKPVESHSDRLGDYENRPFG